MPPKKMKPPNTETSSIEPLQKEVRVRKPKAKAPAAVDVSPTSPRADTNTSSPDKPLKGKVRIRNPKPPKPNPPSIIKLSIKIPRNDTVCEPPISESIGESTPKTPPMVEIHSLIPSDTMFETTKFETSGQEKALESKVKIRRLRKPKAKPPPIVEDIDYSCGLLSPKRQKKDPKVMDSLNIKIERANEVIEKQFRKKDGDDNTTIQPTILDAVPNKQRNRIPTNEVVNTQLVQKDDGNENAIENAKTAITNAVSNKPRKRGWRKKEVVVSTYFQKPEVASESEDEKILLTTEENKIASPAKKTEPKMIVSNIPRKSGRKKKEVVDPTHFDSPEVATEKNNGKILLTTEENKIATPEKKTEPNIIVSTTPRKSGRKKKEVLDPTHFEKPEVATENEDEKILFNPEGNKITTPEKKTEPKIIVSNTPRKRGRKKKEVVDPTHFEIPEEATEKEDEKILLTPEENKIATPKKKTEPNKIVTRKRFADTVIADNALITPAKRPKQGIQTAPDSKLTSTLPTTLAPGNNLIIAPKTIPVTKRRLPRVKKTPTNIQGAISSLSIIENIKTSLNHENEIPTSINTVSSTELVKKNSTTKFPTNKPSKLRKKPLKLDLDGIQSTKPLKSQLNKSSSSRNQPLKRDLKERIRSVESRKSSLSSNSNLSWTKDISSSSTTTCITVSSNDVIRFDKKLPIVKLTNIVGKQNKIKQQLKDDNRETSIKPDNNTESDSDDSSSSSDSSDSSSNSDLNSSLEAKSLNLSVSSPSSHYVRAQQTRNKLNFEKASEKLKSTLKKLDMTILNNMNQIRESTKNNSIVFSDLKFKMLNILDSEFGIISHCRRLKELLKPQSVEPRNEIIVSADCRGEEIIKDKEASDNNDIRKETSHKDSVHSKAREETINKHPVSSNMRKEPPNKCPVKSNITKETPNEYLVNNNTRKEASENDPVNNNSGKETRKKDHKNSNTREETRNKDHATKNTTKETRNKDLFKNNMGKETLIKDPVSNYMGKEARNKDPVNNNTGKETRNKDHENNSTRKETRIKDHKKSNTRKDTRTNEIINIDTRKGSIDNQPVSNNTLKETRINETVYNNTTNNEPLDNEVVEFVKPVARPCTYRRMSNYSEVSNVTMSHYRRDSLDEEDLSFEPQEHYNNSMDAHDDDDALSLFAESITGIESSKINNSTVSIPNYSEPNPTHSEEYIPRPLKDDHALPEKYIYYPSKLPEDINQNRAQKTVCEKQTADSTSIYKESISTGGDSENYEDLHERPELYPPQTVNRFEPPENATKLMASIYPVIRRQKSQIFGGCCFFNLADVCKRPYDQKCRFSHVKPPVLLIKNKLTNLSNEKFIQEYILMRNWPELRRRYAMCFVQECANRDLTRILVEMALDCVVKATKSSEDSTLRGNVGEITLLHLNKEDNLIVVEDLLKIKVYEELMMCDVLIAIMSDTQNFSRFKSIFLNLTYFMVENERKFSLRVAENILERICILPFDEAMAKALIQIMRLTNVDIIHNAKIVHFENRISCNKDVFEEYMMVKQQCEFTSFLTSSVVGDVTEQAPAGRPEGGEGVPLAPSPDTTNLDTKNKLAEEINKLVETPKLPKPPEPIITRTIGNHINRTKFQTHITYENPAPSTEDETGKNYIQNKNRHNKTVFNNIRPLKRLHSDPTAMLPPMMGPPMMRPPMMRPPMMRPPKPLFNRRVVTFRGTPTIYGPTHPSPD